MPALKICGFTRPETFAEASRRSIDAYGFVFVPGSRRYLTPEAFSRFNLTGARGKIVGVFVRPSIEEIEAVLRAGRLDMIQLHGGETREFILQVKERFRLPLIWAIKGREESLQSLEEELHLRKLAPLYDILLLDTGAKGFGGQGVPFDWRLIPYFRALIAPYRIPLWIAGGIHPGNVDELIERYNPDGIDVSSGVEEGGEKSLLLIQKMIEKVKR